jgi:hypothetical protein
MRLASTSDHIDIGKMNQELRIQAKKAKKRQPKGSLLQTGCKHEDGYAGSSYMNSMLCQD